MIKNFEIVKKQLSELAGIVNSFKSEAVQLRIVELIFGIMPEDDYNPEDTKPKPKKPKHKKKASPKPKNGPPKPKKKPATAGIGAIATLSQLAKTDFFSKPKTINDIIAHCDRNHARKFKPNDFSGKLARMIRSKELIRKKNKDNQYEYTKA